MSKMSNLAAVLDEVKQNICDKYCRFPYEVEDQEQMDELCERCPLSRIDAVQSYPDNDGGSWYYHPITGKVVYID